MSRGPRGSTRTGTLLPYTTLFRSEAGQPVLNTVKENRERVGRMLLMHANDREDIKCAMAGDIVAFAGMKGTTTGDTLCDPANPVVLERMEFPDPVIEIAVEPKTKADPERLASALQQPAADAPAFRVRGDEVSGQNSIKWMGELRPESNNP